MVRRLTALADAHADGIADGLRFEAPQTDLALVQIDGGDPLPLGTAKAGDKVVLFGTGATGERRIAQGIVQNDHAFVCWGKPAANDADNLCKAHGFGIEWALVISSDAGSGFSGGPVVNEAGELVGIQSRNFFPSGSFTTIDIAEGQLLADAIPVARDGERVTTAYPIRPALAEFFPDADPTQPVLASALPASPSTWLERWGWVVLTIAV
ncbi:MAG TPA: S1C family serine protease [Aliidongia sp.]|nr:S1C family serine protease [Aliidongia sp.]